ncbi:hypothetical protein [Pseudonocardia alni]|uniref:Uncharacterized protein n=1 Tax=Pseudonocardia alni TaxID=33907 RepID=A0AA44ZR98_PSEA5|nr:hypothetical protein [Pseudonocardia alni]PKB32605.1 hypothetical protein ATL51_4338 [Pseudonocardia alni]
MEDSLRTCALQGCDAPLEPTGDVSGDRPQRRYCSAAHRLAARQVRRAAAQAAGDQRLADTLPWLREPEAVEADERVEPARRGTATRRPVVARQAASAGPDRPGPLRAPRSPLRHRRTLALIGATAVLLGGYALTTSPAVTGAPAPQDRTADQWAGQARIALAALDDELGTLNASERTWQASAHESDRTPAAVAKLQQQRDTLLQQRAALQSQLQVYTSRQDAVDALAAAEQQLAEMDRIVADLPPATRRTPDQMAAAASLEEQRDLRARNRDACAERLAAIDDGIDRARTAPLPGDGDETEKVSDDVLALARGEDPATPEPSGVRRNPEVLAGGRETAGDRERDDVGTSGPPDPRGPLDETRPRAEGPEGASARGPGSTPGRDAGPGEKLGGAVSGAADGVAGLTGGEPGPGDGAGSGAGPGAGSGAAKKADRPEVVPASSEGPVKKVGNGVGEAAQGVGDTAESLGRGVDDVAGGLTGKKSGSGSGGSDTGSSGSSGSSGPSDGTPARSAPAPRKDPAPREEPAPRAAASPASPPASTAPAESSGTERSGSGAQGSGGSRGSGGIVSAVAGSYVESAMGREAAAPVLAEADRQAAEQMAERSGSSGARPGGSSGSSDGSGSDSRSSGSRSSGSDSDSGSSGSRSSRSSDSGSSARSSDPGSSSSRSSGSGSSSSSDSGSSDSGSSDSGSSRSSSSDDSRSSSSDSGSRSSGSDSDQGGGSSWY